MLFGVWFDHSNSVTIRTLTQWFSKFLQRRGWGFRPSAVWRCVAGHSDPDVSGQRTVVIFTWHVLVECRPSETGTLRCIETSWFDYLLVKKNWIFQIITHCVIKTHKTCFCSPLQNIILTVGATLCVSLTQCYFKCILKYSACNFLGKLSMSISDWSILKW